MGKRTLYSQVEAGAEGRRTMIQLREKEMTEEAFIAEAQSIKELCGRYGVPFIINDSTAVAAAVDADGVHVARVTWKQVMSAGGLEKQELSACLRRTVEQALLAEKQGADYLGVGAVFHTGTKKDASDVSFQTLKAICGAVQIPVVAIGGITADNMKHLAGSGICGVAVVSAIFAEADIEQQPEN